MTHGPLDAGPIELPEIAYTATLSLPAASSAVIVVDMQNDFVRPDGSLRVDSAQATLGPMGRLLTQARRAGVRVVYTQDTHFAGDPEWAIWPEHCRHGSWGWQIVDELKPAADDLVVTKSRYDAFYDTSLDHYLSRVWKVENLVIVGTVANICVLHTAGSAGLRWYHVVVPADGTSALTAFDQATALRQVSWLYTGTLTRSVDDISFTTT
jgi:nicotinamidase-related amidase